MILLVKDIRQEASLFFQMMHIRVVHPVFEIKFYLNSFVMVFKKDVRHLVVSLCASFPLRNPNML